MLQSSCSDVWKTGDVYYLATQYSSSYVNFILQVGSTGISYNTSGNVGLRATVEISK